MAAGRAAGTPGRAPGVGGRLSARQRRAERRAAQRRTEREQALQRHGQAADERSGTDRRQPATEMDVERRLRELGLADRRRAQRRLP